LVPLTTPKIALEATPVATQNIQSVNSPETSTNTLIDTSKVIDNKSIMFNKSELEVIQAKKSYIVVGAFFDEVHAQKVKTEVEARGYVTTMTKEYEDVLYRVSVEVETPFASATLGKIKADFNQRAWIYCTDCTLP
jgi:hypothetical protein